MKNNPFIEGSPVVFDGDVPKDFLVKSYKDTFNVDVATYFSSVDKISIYKCKESGYRFYYPLELAGDSEFYEKLQENDWYYMPWKWEHQVCQKFIKNDFNVLEIGCGKGDFLRNLTSKIDKIKCVGLELNKSAVTTEENLKILNTTIEDYSISNEGIFDLVCTFQVLEHVPTVNSFLKANIRCLKDNGLLLISVPNNESFIKYDKSNVLNMPPHHMGLWTEESLKKIGEYYNLELEEVLYEPLQEYHFDWYTYLILRKFTGKYTTKAILKAIRSLKLTERVNKYLKNNSHRIKGHSILIVFKKRNPSNN